MELVNESHVEEALKKSSFSSLESKIVEKCAALCNNYGIAPNDLMNQMDAFFIDDGDSITHEKMGKFEQHIKVELTKQPIRERNTRNEKMMDKFATSPDLKRKNINLTPTSSKSQRSENGTPDTEGSRRSLNSSVLSQDFKPGENLFAVRENKNKEVVKFNENIPCRKEFQPSPRSGGKRCDVKLTEPEIFDNVLERYRFMFTTLEERARALDDHLLELQTDMCHAVGLKEEDLAPVGIPSPESVWVCGRVCNESVKGKLMAKSVLLEGSRLFSGGRRVELDLQNLSQYAVFPGQIVLVHGINASGRKMVADKIIEGVPKKMLTTPTRKVSDYHHSKLYQNGKALSVVVASGPFTTSDNLDYEPLTELLSNIANDKPDVAILIGPFVDATHPILQTGDAVLYDKDEDDQPCYGKEHNGSYEVVFLERFIRDGLGKYFNSVDVFGGVLPTQFIIVPSLLDAHHEYVFPQPPFGDREMIKTKFFEEPLGELRIPFSDQEQPDCKVYLAPNPCMFRVNEVLFGVTSNDTLFALSSDEASKSTGHRMCRMAGHMLQQQSFSPSFPSPLSVPAQLDLRHMKHWKMNATPDVLITPSRLAPMAKEVLGTVVINPGPLAKGRRGGTYSTLSINPLPPSPDDKSDRTHEVPSRTNVSIRKI